MENSPLYKLRFLPLLFGVATLVIGFIVVFVYRTGTSTLILGIIISIVGLLVLRITHRWNRKERFVLHNQTTADTRISLYKPERIKINGFGDECPEIIVTKGEYILLMFQMFPPENVALLKRVPDDFSSRLSEFLGAHVHHEDRELFRIHCDDVPQTIQRIQTYFSG